MSHKMITAFDSDGNQLFSSTVDVDVDQIARVVIGERGAATPDLELVSPHKAANKPTAASVKQPEPKTVNKPGPAHV